VNGCPIAVEVFEGNTKDSSTIASQIEKVRTRLSIKNVVWVTDRGILTNSKINELVKSVDGLDYITGLTEPQIRHLVEVKAVQLGLFDEVNLVEFTSKDFPWKSSFETITRPTRLQQKALDLVGISLICTQ
jgi:transposase